MCSALVGCSVLEINITEVKQAEDVFQWPSVLSVTEQGVLKSLIIIVNLFISPLSPVLASYILKVWYK